MPLKDWTVDRDIVGEVQAAISKRFTVNNIAVDATALAKVRLIDDDGQWLATVPTLPPSSEVDAYIVVVKHLMVVSPGMSGEGLGIWRNVALDKTLLYASYAIALVDAHSLKIIEAHAGVMPPTEPQILPSKDVEFVALAGFAAKRDIRSNRRDQTHRVRSARTEHSGNALADAADRPCRGLSDGWRRQVTAPRCGGARSDESGRSVSARPDMTRWRTKRYARLGRSPTSVRLPEDRRPFRLSRGRDACRIPNHDRRDGVELRRNAELGLDLRRP